MSHRKTCSGCSVDLVQERYTSTNGLDQGWRNIYCYLYPSPVDSNGTLQIKYIKFIDFGMAFDRPYDIGLVRYTRFGHQTVQPDP